MHGPSAGGMLPLTGSGSGTTIELFQGSDFGAPITFESGLSLENIFPQNQILEFPHNKATDPIGNLGGFINSKWNPIGDGLKKTFEGVKVQQFSLGTNKAGHTMKTVFEGGR